MRILYGVVGEGMGHATRSRVVLEHLHARGHELLVVVSGRAHGFLTEAFAGRPRVRVEEITGLHLVYVENEVDKSRSFRENLAKMPEGVRGNLEAYDRVAESFHPELVITDFESWAWAFAQLHDLPVVSIDNMQVINRCAHDDEITDEKCRDFLRAKLAVKAKIPGAYHYLVTSFFFPPVRKKRTTLIPPILRPEVLAARREPGDHLLVYQTSASNPAVLDALRSLGVPCRIYGLGREGVEGDLSFRPFSQTGFVDDLRTARAVVASAGYSLMGEAVHLGVPLLAVPLEGQYEQELNARWLARLGYGAWTRALDGAVLRGFLADLPRHEAALGRYHRHDNAILYACVDELARRVELGEPAPDVLDTPALGDRLLPGF